MCWIACCGAQVDARDEAPLSPWYEEAPEFKEEPEQCDSLAVEAFQRLVAMVKGNVVFSPASMEEMLTTLQKASGEITYAELATLPYGSPTVKSALPLQSVNALFADTSVTLAPGAEHAQRVPFSTAPGDAVKAINTWCKENTNGKIATMLQKQPETSALRLVALNAVHLSASWLAPFTEGDTQKEYFRLPDGQGVGIPMMHQQESFHYAVGDDWQAIALIYRRNGRAGEPACFIGILPRGDARAFISTLTPQKYNDIRRALVRSERQLIDLALPRFKMDGGALSLKPVLQAMGVQQLFSGVADLRGLTPDSVMLDDIQQKIYIEIDENGTEAATVTTTLVPYWMLEESKKRIRFDRPFIWVIGDLTTEAPPYFMGLFENP